MPKSFDTPADNQGVRAIADNEMDMIIGGTQCVFRGDGFQRDSWFVTALTKLMIQGRIREDMSLPLDSPPQEVTIEGRRYRVWQVGETVYVENAV